MDLSSPIARVLLIVLGALLVALLAAAVFLLVRLLRMFAMVRSEAMPIEGKLAFWAALLYTVFPLDLLPDPVLLDDVGVLAGAVAYLGHLATKHGIGRRGTATTPGDGEAAAIER